MRAADPFSHVYLFGVADAAIREVFPASDHPITQQLRDDYADALAEAIARRLSTPSAPPTPCGRGNHRVRHAKTAEGWPRWWCDTCGWPLKRAGSGGGDFSYTRDPRTYEEMGTEQR